MGLLDEVRFQRGPSGGYLRQDYPQLYGALGGLLGTAPDEMQGSVMDPQTAKVRAGAEMGYLPGLLASNLPPAKGAAGLGALAGMFVGKGSKTWDALAASKALRMDKAGDKPLTEAKFYSQYRQHIDLRGNPGAAESVLREGWKPGIGPNVTSPYRGGTPTDIIGRKFMPRADQTVYLVPKTAVQETPNGGKIVAGWKPEPHEVIKVARDGESMYEAYIRALTETRNLDIIKDTTTQTLSK